MRIQTKYHPDGKKLSLLLNKIRNYPKEMNFDSLQCL